MGQSIGILSIEINKLLKTYQKQIKWCFVLDCMLKQL